MPNKFVTMADILKDCKQLWMDHAVNKLEMRQDEAERQWEQTGAPLTKAFLTGALLK